MENVAPLSLEWIVSLLYFIFVVTDLLDAPLSSFNDMSIIQQQLSPIYMYNVAVLRSVFGGRVS